MKPSPLLLIDCVENPDVADSARVREWFGSALEGEIKANFASIGGSHPELDSVLENAEGVILSGSPRDAFAEDEYTARLLRILEEAITRDLPVLGVCYGHQILGRIAGANVSRNPQGWEVGEAVVQLTQAGANSPIFEGLPEAFTVIESHQDAVSDIPASCELLAGNAHTPVQALKWKTNVYGVQFHPEFTRHILQDLWTQRRHQWREKVSFDLDAKLDGVRDVPHCKTIFTNFMNKVVQK